MREKFYPTAYTKFIPNNFDDQNQTNSLQENKNNKFSDQFLDTIANKDRKNYVKGNFQENLFATISKSTKNIFQANSLQQALDLLKNPEETKINIGYKTDRELRENMLDKIGKLIVSNPENLNSTDFLQKNKDYIHLLNNSENFNAEKFEFN